jgi:hypothetical protein
MMDECRNAPTILKSKPELWKRLLFANHLTGAMYLNWIARCKVFGSNFGEAAQ